MESNLRILLATLLTIGLWSTIRGLQVSSMPEIITRNGYSCKKVMDRCHENHHYCYYKNGYYVPCDRFCPPTRDTASSKDRCLSWCEVYFDLECFPATSMQTSTKSTSQYTLGGLMGTTAAATGTLSGGQIAGIVIGGISVLFIIIMLIVCHKRLRCNKSHSPMTGGIQGDKQESERFVCSSESGSDGAVDQITSVELPGATKVVITGSGSQPNDGGHCAPSVHNGVRHNGISTGQNASLAFAKITPAPSEPSAPEVQTPLGAPPGVSDDSSTVPAAASTTPAAYSQPVIPVLATSGDSAQPPSAAAPATPAAILQPAAPPSTPGDSAQPAPAPTTSADSASRPTGSSPTSATGDSSPTSATGDSSPGPTESPPPSHANEASSGPSSTNTGGTAGGQQPYVMIFQNANVNMNFGDTEVNNYLQANQASSDIGTSNSNCSASSPTTVASQPTTTEAEQPTNTEGDGDQTPEPATD